MRLTCEDILEHQKELNLLPINAKEKSDIITRFVLTFEPNFDTAIDLLETAKKLLMLIMNDENKRLEEDI